MTRNDPKALKIVGGVFLPLGLTFLVVTGLTGNRQYTILKTWPTVEAEVTRSSVSHHQSSSSSSSSSTTMYQAEIEFRYTVGGKQYVTPASSAYSSSSYTEMKRKVDFYAPGTRHPIRYNPADPNDIRFDVGYNFGFFLLPFIFGIMGLVFGGVGAGLLFGWRSVSRGQPRCPSCGQPTERSQRFCPNCAAPLATG